LIVNPITTRITFGDEAMTGATPITHTAVVLKTSDAKALGELLLKIIAKNEETRTAAKLLSSLNDT
jgi:hypothetical protein